MNGLSGYLVGAILGSALFVISVLLRPDWPWWRRTLAMLSVCAIIVTSGIFCAWISLVISSAQNVDQAAHEKTLYDALDACLESYEQCREECGR